MPIQFICLMSLEGLESGPFNQLINQNNQIAYVIHLSIGSSYYNCVHTIWISGKERWPCCIWLIQSGNTITRWSAGCSFPIQNTKSVQNKINMNGLQTTAKLKRYIPLMPLPHRVEKVLIIITMIVVSVWNLGDFMKNLYFF